ncbi:MAG: hypothetical protein LQ338_000195 [Usnochroma carphineum]|nr:MAG: hypothetical protein LQ338_000195 [Usnochroma carphineum]
MQKIRQAGTEAHRRYSSPVPPKTIKQCMEAVTPEPSSSEWRPFHVFSTNPKETLRTEALASEPFLSRQKRLFHIMEIICTNAARKYWRSQCSSISFLPPITHRSATSLLQQSYLFNGNSISHGTQEHHADDRNESLVGYILHINDRLFRRATASAGNYDAAMTQTLMQMMKLLMCAEQLQHLSREGGLQMSDDAIGVAVEGARDLLCWLQDGEAINEFDELWQEKFVDGTLVLSEEELDPGCE